jgi:hypothetical protein
MLRYAWILASILAAFPAAAATAPVATDPPSLPGTTWDGGHREKYSARRLGSCQQLIGIEVRFLSASTVRITDSNDDVYTGTYVLDGNKILVSLDAPSLFQLAGELAGELADIASKKTGRNINVRFAEVSIVAKVSGNGERAKLKYRIKATLEVDDPLLGTVPGKYQASGRTQIRA